MWEINTLNEGLLLYNIRCNYKENSKIWEPNILNEGLDTGFLHWCIL